MGNECSDEVCGMIMLSSSFLFADDTVMRFIRTGQSQIALLLVKSRDIWSHICLKEIISRSAHFRTILHILVVCVLVKTVREGD